MKKQKKRLLTRFLGNTIVVTEIEDGEDIRNLLSNPPTSNTGNIIVPFHPRKAGLRAALRMMKDKIMGVDLVKVEDSVIPDSIDMKITNRAIKTGVEPIDEALKENIARDLIARHTEIENKIDTGIVFGGPYGTCTRIE